MKTKSRVHDIAIRFPPAKKHIKKDLLKIAKRNGMTVTMIVTIALEEFVEIQAASLN